MIFIEAGHNNQDPGAVARGLKEADLTKEFRGLLVTSLIDQSEGIVISHDDDRDSLPIMLRKYNALALKEKTINISLSLHWNAARPDASGTEIFVPERHTIVETKLANKILNNVSSMMKIRNRGVKVPSQSHRGRLYIEQMADVNLLWEIGFLTSEKDVKAYNDNKEKLADEVAYLLIKEYKRLNRK